MIETIEKMVSDFENGKISRRQFAASLADDIAARLSLHVVGSVPEKRHAGLIAS